MKAKLTIGGTYYATHRIIGTEIGAGSELTIIEEYVERGYEPRYLVKTFGGFKAYVYESDLSKDWDCSECASHYGDDGQCDEGKPINSRHRRPEVRRGGLYCTHSEALASGFCPDCEQTVNLLQPGVLNACE